MVQQLQPRRARGGWGRVLAVVAVVLGLACAGVASAQARTPAASRAPRGHGTVLLAVTVNTSELTQFDAIQLRRVRPASSGLPELFWLRNKLGALSRDTALFTGHLPAGDYRLVSLHDTSAGKWVDLSKGMMELLGDFAVRPGPTVDLGRLVLAGHGQRGPRGESMVSLGRSRLVTSNRELIARAAPIYLKYYDGPVTTGWLDVRHPADMVETYALARPQGATGFSELSTGEIVGGTRMGTVLMRATDGRWSAFARTGGLDAILWTVPYEHDGLIAVAAGELGTLVGVERSGQLRRIDPGNLPAGNLYFVDHSPDGTRWIVGVSTATAVALYSSPRLDGGTWTRMRGSSVKPTFWSGAAPAWAWARPGGVGFAASRSHKMACYDYASGTWSEHDSPGQDRVLGIRAWPHGPIEVQVAPGGFGAFVDAAYGTDFASARNYSSLDCGATWVEGRYLDKGGMLTTPLVFQNVLWPLPSAGWLSVSRGQDGAETISHSPDRGRTWTAETSTAGSKTAPALAPGGQ